MRITGLKPLVILTIFMTAIALEAIFIPASTSAESLSGEGDQVWSQDSPDIEDFSEATNYFGRSVATGDFNNDNFADLAIGVPGEDTDAGAVNVIFGSSSGLSATATADQFWSQNSPNILDASEAGDGFGHALSSGDFDHDGFADLAIGVPYENIEGISDAGAVNILHGATGGLSASWNQIWHQNSLGISGVAETSDAFGRALSSGDFNSDGYADLAIGVPYEDVGSTGDGDGAVNVLDGSHDGLSVVGEKVWHQDSSGISGVGEAHDWFGYALSSGDFDNDGVADLAIGVPQEHIGDISDAGAVNVLYGAGTRNYPYRTLDYIRADDSITGDPGFNRTATRLSNQQLEVFPDSHIGFKWQTGGVLATVISRRNIGVHKA